MLLLLGFRTQSSPKDLKPEDVSDGSVDGVPYFTCSPGRGVITSVNRIKLNILEQDQADQFMAARKSKSQHAKGSSSAQHQQAGRSQPQAENRLNDIGSAKATSASSSSSSSHKGPMIGQIVWVSDRDDPSKKHQGSVVWTGTKQVGGQLRQVAKLKMVCVTIA